MAIPVVSDSSPGTQTPEVLPALPAGYGVLLSQAGWHPLFLWEQGHPLLARPLQADDFFPPAYPEGRAFPEHGCSTLEEAITWCWQHREEHDLQGIWRQATAHLELYPERIIWYVEEITWLTGEPPSLRALRTSSGERADVYGSVRQPPGDTRFLTACHSTAEETVKALYEQLIQAFQEQSSIEANIACDSALQSAQAADLP